VHKNLPLIEFTYLLCEYPYISVFDPVEGQYEDSLEEHTVRPRPVHNQPQQVPVHNQPAQVPVHNQAHVPVHNQAATPITVGASCVAPQTFAKKVDDRCMRSIQRKTIGTCSLVKELLGKLRFLADTRCSSTENALAVELDNRCMRAIKRQIAGSCKRIKNLLTKMNYF
jgi:hypothetical protein